MINLKKAALAVLALSVNSIASAGMYTPPPATTTGCTPAQGNNVTLPCEKQAWSFSANAIYVETNNVGQVTVDTTTTPTTFNENINDFPNNWQWGFEMAAGYYFGTGNDVNINWTHFVHGSTENTTAATGDVLVGMYINNELDSGETVDNISSYVGNDFNAINFEFGQMVHFGEHVDTRLHGGIQYAQIDQSLNQTGWNGSDSAVTDASYSQSKFNGLGPRIGLDSAYNFNHGISLFGNLAGALLIGDLDFNNTENFTNSEGANVFVDSASSDYTNVVVPELEAKLGIRYVQPFADGDLSFNVGYEVVNYFDASTLTTLAADYLEKTNFEYDGVFFGMKWLGDM